ncbi:hypothetical protein [Frankia sp. QA3]|uniref:hypothetical protein n=1 Tax=Frankia sp. QA3 TaxID=710111 RepID=UPI000269D03B|nr:hypothetical protein [Frankia sp. QA3]EIV95225.1 hypothetical protein FraQA3DRAFT_5033 [Frankia sp. QA3]
MRPRLAVAPAVPLAGDAGHGVPQRDWTAPGLTGTGATASEVSDGPGRPATEAEAAAITAAVLDSPLVATLAAGGLRITGIRTSTGAPDWAFAVLRAPGGTDPAIAVLRWDTCCGWVLDQVGTARLGLGAGGGGPTMRRADLPVAGAASVRRRDGGVRRGCESGVRTGDAARSR